MYLFLSAPLLLLSFFLPLPVSLFLLLFIPWCRTELGVGRHSGSDEDGNGQSWNGVYDAAHPVRVQESCHRVRQCEKRQSQCPNSRLDWDSETHTGLPEGESTYLKEKALIWEVLVRVPLVSLKYQGRWLVLLWLWIWNKYKSHRGTAILVHYLRKR